MILSFLIYYERQDAFQVIEGSYPKIIKKLKKKKMCIYKYYDLTYMPFILIVQINRQRIIAYSYLL